MGSGKRNAGTDRATPPGWWRAAAVAAVAALLAGCGAVQRMLPPAVAPRPPAARSAARPPAPPPPPARPVLPTPMLPTPVLPTPMLPVPAPLDLANLPADRVEALLGAPAARTASGTGERWTYRATGCALELFLFPAVGGGGLAVLDRRASGTGEQECLRRLRGDGA